MAGGRNGRRESGRRGTGTALGSLFVSLVAAVAPLQGQSAASGGLGIDHFGPEQGLPGQYIPDMAVTADGLLWLISSGRLTSFDGLTFEDHGVPGSEPGESVVAVGAGAGDTLWVCVGTRLLSWVQGQAAERARHDKILRDVWQEADGSLWGWDDLGVVRLGPTGFERGARLRDGWNWGQIPPDTMGVAGQRGAWILDADGGAARRVHSSWVVEPTPFPEAWPVRARPGRVLVSRRTGDRIEVRTLDGRSVGAFAAASGRRAAFLDADGLLWTFRPGAMEAFTVDGLRVAALPVDPDAGGVSVVEDAEENRWVGTVRGGLYRIRPRPVRVLGAAQGLTDGQVARVSEGDDGSVLVLQDDGTLKRVSGTDVDTLFRASLADGAATAALADSRGTVWIAVRRGPEYRMVGRTRDGRELEIPVPPFPTRIVQDPYDDGLLWLMGTGVHRLRPYDEPAPSLEGPLLPFVGVARDLLVDHLGAVWVAGQEGLAVLEPTGETRTFAASDGFPTGDARALHESSDRTLWIGRYFGGLTLYRDGRFESVGAEDGLWDDVVSSLLEDRRGNLWMGSNRGVHRVARTDVEEFLDGRIESVRGIGYGGAAGFQNPEASGWYGHRSADGRLWLPTFSGVAVIDPEGVVAAEQTPFRVRVRGVRIGTETVSPEGPIQLARGQRRVEVMFGSVRLSGQEGIRYRVRLEGVDTDWADVGGQRQVTYANLPPGRHAFRVRAETDAGGVSANEAALTLVVPPFFYETWGFRLLLALMAGATLAGAYRLRVRQLRGHEATLRRLVDERTRDLVSAQSATEDALATVEAQAAELRALGEAKSRFFASVSHELRTPLTLMLGPLRDVVDGLMGETSEPVDEQLRLVLSNGHRLGELVEQLLDVARLDSGSVRLRLHEVDLRPMLERLAASFDALGRRREVTLDVAFPEGPLVARVDSDHIQKIFGNLLANAFEFTPAGGRIRFSVTREGEAGDGTILTVVEDSGPGIPAEELERIFWRFHQVDGSVRRTQGGMGLGLSLVKELTELHGGRVAVWSEPGRGSRFTVRIPVLGPEARVAGEVAVEAPGPADAPAIAGGDDPGHPRPADEEIPEDALRPTVLLVEDNEDLRAYLRRHLEDRYRIAEARDGEEGLEMARRSVPDLILCDIMMPRMDGEQMCRAVRADPELAFLPVIMVTAKAARSSRLSALEGGADDYIVKPFDRDELRLRVENALASRRRLAQRLMDEGKTLPLVSLGPLAAKTNGFAEKLDQVLRDHLADEDFGVEALARALAMSRATLYRKTEDAVGTSPMELLWRYRLALAARLLQETDANVSEVAYACGFKTVPHFTRKFREHFGRPPAAYRAR